MSYFVPLGDDVVKPTTIRIIPPSVNERLEVLAIFHLGIVLFTQITIAFRFCRIELRKVSGQWHDQDNGSEWCISLTPCSNLDDRSVGERCQLQQHL